MREGVRRDEGGEEVRKRGSEEGRVEVREGVEGRWEKERVVGQVSTRMQALNI